MDRRYVAADAATQPRFDERRFPGGVAWMTASTSGVPSAVDDRVDSEHLHGGTSCPEKRLLTRRTDGFSKPPLPALPDVSV
jgi:hypothetical protein